MLQTRYISWIWENLSSLEGLAAYNVDHSRLVSAGLASGSSL